MHIKLKFCSDNSSEYIHIFLGQVRQELIPKLKDQLKKLGDNNFIYLYSWEYATFFDFLSLGVWVKLKTFVRKLYQRKTNRCRKKIC